MTSPHHPFKSLNQIRWHSRNQEVDFQIQRRKRENEKEKEKGRGKGKGKEGETRIASAILNQTQIGVSSSLGGIDSSYSIRAVVGKEKGEGITVSHKPEERGWQEGRVVFDKEIGMKGSQSQTTFDLILGRITAMNPWISFSSR